MNGKAEAIRERLHLWDKKYNPGGMSEREQLLFIIASDAIALCEAEPAQETSEAQAIKQAVVDTVGGIVEGRPTNRLNYLQRLRALVDKEASAQLSEKALRDALANLEYQISTDGGEEAIEFAMQQAQDALAQSESKDKTHA